ncbi:ubiquitin-like protein 4A [Ixodes scapularis]|uniref:ubiquitin-like protein 4A n=1 Tax=Ixodes scapularis TaxID=6945 RepID=UPI001C390885|nr:ubiquitin-like protein 4A [Ixodes scapularis]
MFISVKILQGQECTIEVSASSSISAVKQLVAQELQIPVDQQRLVFRGKTLSDGLSLEDYNIEEGNRLHLFVLKTAEDAALAWDQMRKFLLSQFSPEDAEKVLEEYKKDFSRAAASLSLDDIERLASAGLDTTTSTTSATGGAPTRPPGRESDGAVGMLVVNSEDSAAS